MSRRAFREPLAGPRPNAAYGLAATASLTLAATGEVEPWALPLAAGGLALAWLRRVEPQPWQRSGLLLGGVAVAAALLAGAVWWSGRLAMVALAHFALLAQPLQLLDARPRRSEFLLVALALFQVVLAANLTASLLFPPLLAVFTACAVWTLLVHTLRAEALEAGEPEAARRALSGGLRRTAVWASLLTFVGAILLFPLLPRMRAGAFFGGPANARDAVSGFSEEVRLGEIGRIRQDATVVLRVEALEEALPAPEERYWGGIALDRFDGRSWSLATRAREPVRGDPERGLRLAESRRGPRLEQRITREGLGSGVVFIPGRPLALQGDLGRVERGTSGALYSDSTAGQRVSYTIAAEGSAPDPDALRRDRAVPPVGSEGRFHQIPEALEEPLGKLAAELTGNATTDAERVRALERALRRRGRYTDRPPQVADDPDRSPVLAFLEGGMEGHCEYFATSMALLARAEGLPARVVNGFAGGRANPIGGFVELAQSDAHTWVEVHYEDAGWVRYDPTPPDLRLAGARALGERPTLADLASAVQLWWYRDVIDFDRTRQAKALRSAWRAWRRWRGPESHAGGDAPAGRSTDPSLPTPPGWVLGALVAAGLAAFGLRRALGPRARRAARLPGYYAKALRLLARRGHVRPPGTPVRSFARETAAMLPPEGAHALDELTAAYLGERFGERPAPAPPEARRALRALRDSLRE